MTFTPPAPPTPPAPAVRPTPPTPPRIDKTPFANDSSDDVANEQPVDETEETPADETQDKPAQIETPPVEIPQLEKPHVNRKVEDPESMARDAVANGSGPLTKRTVGRGDEKPANQTVTVIPPDAPLISDGQSDYDRGKDILRQFREEDARENQQQLTENQPRQTVTEQPRTFKPTINYHEGHGGAFWIGTIIFVAVASFVVVKKFLFTDKPALTKSELFADETDRLKVVRGRVSGVREETSPPKPVAKPVAKPVPSPIAKPVPKPVTKPINKPVTKTARPSKKDDDDKGKHFEIRI